MRLLHTSDWHLGRTLEGRSRIGEQSQFLSDLVHITNDEEVDLVLVAGDIFDAANPPAEAEDLYYGTLEKLSSGGKRAVVVIAGNHDSPDRVRAPNPLASRHGISLVGYPLEDLGVGGPEGGARRVRTGPGWIEVFHPSWDRSAFIVTLAYPSESRLKEVLSRSLEPRDHRLAYSDRIASLVSSGFLAASPGSAHIVLGHLFTTGGWESDSERHIQLGGALSVDPRAFPDDVDYVALGHLHRPQVVAGRQNVRYSGSPLVYSFNEADHQKEVVVTDLNPGAPQIRTVGLNSGMPLKRWESGDLGEVLRWCEEPSNLSCWVELTLHRPEPVTPSEMATLRGAHPRIVALRWRSTAEAEKDESPRIASLSVVERFLLFCRRQGIEPREELVELFLELLNEEHPGEVDRQ